MKKLLFTTLALGSMAASVYADAMTHHHVHRDSSVGTRTFRSQMYTRLEVGSSIQHFKEGFLMEDTTLSYDPVKALASQKLVKNMDSSVGSIGLGYKFNRTFDADIKATYAGSSIVSLSANLYGMYNTPSSRFAPYATVGVGHHVYLRNIKFSSERAFFTLGLGVRMDLMKSLDADFGYRFATSFKKPFKNMQIHQILGGVLYHF